MTTRKLLRNKQLIAESPPVSQRGLVLTSQSGSVKGVVLRNSACLALAQVNSRTCVVQNGVFL